MCDSPHLQSLLLFLETPLINKDVMVLFDGDPIQMGTRRNGQQHSTVPFLMNPEFSPNSYFGRTEKVSLYCGYRGVYSKTVEPR
jgi:hypothetical protein